MMLAVSEIFGPTLQGEGPAIGTPAAFLRLAGCNLACRWCDTPYSWDWKSYDPRVEVTKQAASEVVELVRDHLPRCPNPLVVITGGEPMLQQRELAEVVGMLRGHGCRIEIETAGTIAPTAAITQAVARFVVSPKLAHSGNPDSRIDGASLAALSATGKAVWKFVVAGVDDLEEVAAIVATHRLEGPVYVMPEGTVQDDIDARARAIASAVIDHGWHLTTRLHVALWGSRRGV